MQRECSERTEAVMVMMQVRDREIRHTGYLSALTAVRR